MVAMDVETPAVVGAAEMAALPVASRVNFKLFAQAGMGAAVRVGGRLSADAPGQDRTLTTTDGGSLKITDLPETLPADVAGGAFVEVVGTKAGDAEVRMAGIITMPGKEPMVDAEMWDEAVRLAQVPQLRDLFVPQAAV
eukprot:CAMPEP_0170268486 /NCGR_PEP_ID=MMETSP0116_2-20130129/34176_1 /TAXON_ID=400756 /ORGANISM="Durinskia baltica, Strain CSIRO CS-38" /LENGTH=138 /DNA_ID=CAMNT_0010519655 /DNA_START=70 /DNA_END=486 /DNA_ORIENTATION=-